MLLLPFDISSYNWAHHTTPSPTIRKVGLPTMLWQSLDSLKIELHMKYPTILPPRERDQVIIEIAIERVYSTADIQSINRCQGMLQCIFLSDVVTADGRYLESFVFDPGPFRSQSVLGQQ
jgi:hypothetical protein